MSIGVETARQRIFAGVDAGRIPPELGFQLLRDLEGLQAHTAQTPGDQASAVRDAVRAEFGDTNVEPIAKFFEMLATGRTANAQKATPEDIHGAAQHLFASHGSRFAELAAKFDKILTNFPGLALGTSIAKMFCRSAAIDVAFKVIPPPVGPTLASWFKAFGNGGFAGLTKSLSSVTDNKFVAATLQELAELGADKFALNLLHGPIGTHVGNLGLGLLSEDSERVAQQVTSLLQTVGHLIHFNLKGKVPDGADVGSGAFAAAGAR